MPNFWGPRQCCCNARKCECVKLQNFAVGDWKLSNGVIAPRTLFGANDSGNPLQGATSGGGLYAITLSSLEEDGETVAKVNLTGDFNMPGSQGAFYSVFATVYIDLPLDNYDLKYPTKFAYCWQRKLIEGESAHSIARSTYVYPAMVSADIPDAYIGPDPDEFGAPSRAAEYRAAFQTRGAVTFQYGERAIVRPTGVTGYASEFQTVDRGNGYLYGSAFHGEDTTPHSDYTDSLEVSGQLTGHNWPLRFGLLIEWLVPTGGPVSIDSTVAIRRFRVGFPERVNYVCCGNLVEPAGAAYPDVGKWQFWDKVRGTFENEHHSDDISFYPDPVAPGSYWPRNGSNVIGTPETNPESWFPLRTAIINTGSLTQLSGTYEFYRENESFSASVCRIQQEYFPEYWSGSTVSHVYREVCNADGTYEYHWTITLSYYNYDHTITTSQVWLITNPDFGAWNVAVPISGYSDGFDAAGKEMIRLSIAFTIGDSVTSLGGDLIGYGSSRFVNASVGYGY